MKIFLSYEEYLDWKKKKEWEDYQNYIFFSMLIFPEYYEKAYRFNGLMKFIRNGDN